MKKIILYAMILAISLSALIACNSKQTEELQFFQSGRIFADDNGVFFVNGYTSLMTYYEYDLQESIPLCDNPECSHDSRECSAYTPEGYSGTVTLYQDKLYFISRDDNDEAFQYSLWSSDKNGKNRKRILQLQNIEGDMEPDHNAVSCVFDGWLYFQANITFFSDTYDDEVITDYIINSQICRVQLSTGTLEAVTELREVEDTECYFLKACTDKGLIVYQNDSSKMLDYYSIDYETKSVELLFDSQEGHSYDLYVPYCSDSYQLLISDTTGNIITYYLFDWDTGEQHVIFQGDITKTGDYQCSNLGTEIYIREWDWSTDDQTIYCYDIVDNSMTECVNFPGLPQNFIIEDKLIFFGEEGYYWYYKTDLEKGNLDNIYIIGMF